VEPFREATGPTTAIPVAVAEIFLLLFSMAIMQLIVEQTNLYASRVMGTGHSGRAEGILWLHDIDGSQ